MIALSDQGWAFLGLLVVQIFSFAALFLRQGRNGKGIAQINTAVNHQSEGSPTLVQRVSNVEVGVELARRHRIWERSAFVTIANHVGCVLPPYPPNEQQEAP